MATQTLSNLGTALKQTYLGPIRDQLNNATIAYNRLEKHDEEVTGLDLTVQIPLFHGRNQGIGWRAEGGTLPTAGRRSHTKASLAMAYVYGQIKISGQAIKASRSNMGAFTKVVTNEVRGMVQGMKVELNRAMWGDGSGAMAKITQATGSITAGDYFTVDDATRLENGMTFDTYAAKTGGSVVLDSKIISQVDVRNNKVSLTTTQTVTQNDFIFREDSRGLLMMGLEGIVDGADTAGNRIVSTHQGIARSTNIWWDGNVLDNSGTDRAISNTLVQQAFELGEIVGGGRCSLIMSGYPVRRAFIDLQLVDRRFAGMTTLDGGWRIAWAWRTRRSSSTSPRSESIARAMDSSGWTSTERSCGKWPTWTSTRRRCSAT